MPNFFVTVAIYTQVVFGNLLLNNMDPNADLTPLRDVGHDALPLTPRDLSEVITYMFMAYAGLRFILRPNAALLFQRQVCALNATVM